MGKAVTTSGIATQQDCALTASKLYPCHMDTTLPWQCWKSEIRSTRKLKHWWVSVYMDTDFYAADLRHYRQHHWCRHMEMQLQSGQTSWSETLAVDGHYFLNPLQSALVQGLPHLTPSMALHNLQESNDWYNWVIARRVPSSLMQKEQILTSAYFPAAGSPRTAQSLVRLLFCLMMVD